MYESTMQVFHVLEPFLDLRCGLSEGPFWEEDENVLRFVDIVNKNVYRVDLSVGPSSLQKYQFDMSIGVTAEIELPSRTNNNSFLFGGKYGIGIAKKNRGEHRLIQHFWTDDERKEGKDVRMRANDGAVDSQGRFWVGTLCDPQETAFAPDGVLFRLDLDGTIHRVITGLTIPNGMSWSKDDRIFYFTDSATRSIFAYDYDAASGSICNKRIFFKVQEEGCVPDGHAQDDEGNLWVAVWGGWKVAKVSPNGKITAEVRLPTRCITAVVFAGEDLYITSEADPEPTKYPASLRYHGGVFKCHVGIKGRRHYKARLHSSLE